MRAVIHVVKIDPDREWTGVQGFVKPSSELFIRRMVPWQCHVEQANEHPFVHIANIADRDIVVDLFLRAWIPQGEPLRQCCELVIVNGEGLNHRHEGLN